VTEVNFLGEGGSRAGGSRSTNYSSRQAIGVILHEEVYQLFIKTRHELQGGAVCHVEEIFVTSLLAATASMNFAGIVFFSRAGNIICDSLIAGVAVEQAAATRTFDRKSRNKYIIGLHVLNVGGDSVGIS